MAKFFEKSSSLLIYSLPILTITGPFLSDLAIVLTGFFFLIILFKKKQFSFLKNKYSTIFFCFCAYIILRSIFTGEIISIKSSIFFFRFGLFSLAFYYLVINKIVCLKTFLKILILLLVIVLSDSLIQFFFGVNFIGLEKMHPNRVSSFFGNELVLGSFSLRVFLLIIPLLLIFKESKIIPFVVITIVTILIILSGERTAFGLVIVFFGLSIFVIIDKFKYTLISFAILLSLTSVLIYSNPSLHKRIIAQTKSNFYFSKEEKIIAFSQVHYQHYSTGYKMFKDNIIFGIGPKMFRVKCDDLKYNSGQFSCATHPHNILIQFLAEFGLLGFIFLVYFYYLLICNILNAYKIKNLNNKKAFMLINLLILLIFFPFLPYGNFLNNWLSIFNILSISLVGLLKNDRFKFD